MQLQVELEVIGMRRRLPTQQTKDLLEPLKTYAAKSAFILQSKPINMSRHGKAVAALVSGAVGMLLLLAGLRVQLLSKHLYVRVVPDEVKIAADGLLLKESAKRPVLGSVSNQTTAPGAGPTKEVRWNDSVRIAALVASALADRKNRALHGRFLDFFQGEKVLNFVDDYGKSCSTRQQLFTVLFDNTSTLGYTGCLNNAISTFVLTKQPSTGAQYRFRFIDHNWSYSPLQNYFKDIGKTANCSFFWESGRTWNATNTGVQVGISFSNGTGVTINQTGDTIMQPASVAFNGMREVFSKLAVFEGTAAIFAKKSAIAKAIWQPVKELENILFLMWQQLNARYGSYVGVHVRRGDGDMAEVPLYQYSKKIQNITTGNATVFVMTDDEKSFSDLSVSVGTGKIMNLKSLLIELGMPVDDYYVAAPGKEIKTRPATNRRFWTAATTQLVMEISLLSMADQIVCTMSSNVCRFAALLKGSYEGKVHSLDLPWHAN